MTRVHVSNLAHPSQDLGADQTLAHTLEHLVFMVRINDAQWYRKLKP
jgi:hypothetical protein